LGRTTDTREQTRLAWKGLSGAGTQASLTQWHGQFPGIVPSEESWNVRFSRLKSWSADSTSNWRIWMLSVNRPKP